MLVFFVLCIGAHLVTTHRDLQIAIRTRKVTAFEQQVHSVLEGAPVAALLLLVVLHWPQAEALVGRGAQAEDFTIAWDFPSNWYAVAAIFTMSVLFLLIPYADEFLRGMKAQAKGQVGE
jgi:hypothetical protein